MKPAIKVDSHKNSLYEVLDYILNHEKEDFDLNPSDNHVYYHAYVVEYGGKAAREMLEKSILDVEELFKDLKE